MFNRSTRSYEEPYVLGIPENLVKLAPPHLAFADERGLPGYPDMISIAIIIVDVVIKSDAVAPAMLGVWRMRLGVVVAALSSIERGVRHGVQLDHFRLLFFSSLFPFVLDPAVQECLHTIRPVAKVHTCDSPDARLCV